MRERVGQSPALVPSSGGFLDISRMLARPALMDKEIDPLYFLYLYVFAAGANELWSMTCGEECVASISFPSFCSLLLHRRVLRRFLFQRVCAKWASVLNRQIGAVVYVYL